MRYLLLILSALALSAQTPKDKITVIVERADGTKYTAKITGAPATAGIEVLELWNVTQKTCDNATPQVCTPIYDNVAETGKGFIIKGVEQLAPQFPSSATQADVAEIKAKIASLEAKRKALFDAAKSGK